MKKFIEVEIEVIKMTAEDVIRTSGGYADPSKGEMDGGSIGGLFSSLFSF